MADGAEHPRRSTDVAARFGANLRRFRRTARLSQEGVASRSGLHRTEIGLLERGERTPRIDTVARLAGALSIAPGELFDGIAWEPGKARSGGFKIALAAER
jgi:transcriptional regulator with XRE-family HTH domain